MKIKLFLIIIVIFTQICMVRICGNESLSVQIQPGIDIFTGNSLFFKYGINFELGYDFYNFNLASFKVQTALNLGLSNRINANWSSNANIAFSIFPETAVFDHEFQITPIKLHGLIIRRSLFYSFEDNNGTRYNSEFYDFNFVLYRFKRENKKNLIGLALRIAPQESDQNNYIHGAYLFFKMY